MSRSKGTFFSAAFVLGVLAAQWCVGPAGGIVVRLGDAAPPHLPVDAEVGVVHILPRVFSNAAKQPRRDWKPTTALLTSLPLAYVVRRLPLLSSAPQQSAAAPESPFHEEGRVWVEHAPLPYYPLSPPRPTGRTLVAFQEVLRPKSTARQRLEDALRIREHQLPPLAPTPTKHHVQQPLPLLPFSPPTSKKLSLVAKKSNVAGRAGIDYPTYGSIPETSFSCKDQRYKGFFGDPETGCQAWHYCDFNGGQASFLCPNGTIFSQVLFTCDWWFNVQCNSTLQLYVINERLYKYIIPMPPSFPEDYHGPEVNQYLTLKFMELMQKEQKKLREKLKNSEKDDKQSDVNAIGSVISDEGLINKQHVGLTNELVPKEVREEVESKNIFISP